MSLFNHLTGGALLTFGVLGASAQPYLGADLSYANGVEDNGGVFADVDGTPIDDVYEYFAERGANAVRLRLWYDPTNVTSDCGEPITENGLADALRGAQRTADAGMDLILALHYGDYFVDPGKQPRPAAWNGVTGRALEDSIFDYTLRVLEAMHAQGTVPAVLAVGNETDNGFVDATARTNGFSWPEDAGKFNAGLAAVDTFNARFGESTTAALHITAENARFVAEALTDNDVTNYDLLGVSYYPHFTKELTVDGAIELLTHLKDTYGKEVMWFETGFSWTRTGFADSYRNFLGTNGDVISQPTSREGQRDFLVELTRRTLAAGGRGVLYWEPAWVTSELCDQWDQGSSYENATFFDFENGNRALPAFDFFRDGLVGLRQNFRDVGLRAFPNPLATDSSTLRIEAGEPLARWRLYDAAGRLLAGDRFDVVGEAQQLGQVPAGATQLVVVTAEGYEASVSLVRL